MPKLKPCPFCGGEAKIRVNNSTLNTQAMCMKCNVIMKKSFKGDRKIKELLENLISDEWNKRYSDGE